MYLFEFHKSSVMYEALGHVFGLGIVCRYVRKRLIIHCSDQIKESNDIYMYNKYITENIELKKLIINKITNKTFLGENNIIFKEFNADLSGKCIRVSRIKRRISICYILIKFITTRFKEIVTITT